MNLDTSIKAKRVLLLGSSGVLGKTHAEFLVHHGAQLVIADQMSSSVAKDADRLAVPYVQIDASDEQSVVEGVKAAAEYYGGFDGAIYNSAVTSEGLSADGDPFAPFESSSLSVWKRAIDVNLTGAYIFAREMAPLLRNSKCASLINISSIYGVVAPDHRIYDDQTFKSFAAYSASKAGLIGFSKWLATWWAREGIRVNCITPGGVYNNHSDSFQREYGNRTPLGRMALREEISGIFLYLLSDSSRYCTGQNFIIDGGFSTW